MKYTTHKRHPNVRTIANMPQFSFLQLRQGYPVVFESYAHLHTVTERAFFKAEEVAEFLRTDYARACKDIRVSRAAIFWKVEIQEVRR